MHTASLELCEHRAHVHTRIHRWTCTPARAPGHYKENECMRQGYEPLMRKYGVDIM